MPLTWNLISSIRFSEIGKGNICTDFQIRFPVTGKENIVRKECVRLVEIRQRISEKVSL